LRQRIIDDIIKPILQTADVLDQFLANTGQTFADCTQNTMAYLMLSQAWKTLVIWKNIEYIKDFVAKQINRTSAYHLLK
jgi:hypothetical protein